MKHWTSRIPLLVAVTATLVGTAIAQGTGDNCSFARAAGSYGFSDGGTIVGVGPRAATGKLTFEADGKLEGPVTASLNGSVSQTKLTGTYTVKSDCTGSANFAELDGSGNVILTATVYVVWDNNMHDLRFVFTSIVLANGTPLPAVVSGSATKQNSSND